jgi:glucokinase-like ROK family protein
MKVDKRLIAKLNKSNVIDLIRKEGPINKAEIARLTGLSIPTVMKISDEFMQNHLVQIVGKGESNGGKRPELMQLISDANYIVGVDIGRSRTTAIVMDLSGKVISKKTMETGETQPVDVLVQRIINLISQTIYECKIAEEKLLGMGIVTPGLIDIETKIIIFSPDFGWENIDIVTPIKNKFNLPVHLENSNRAVAMGEKWFGAAKDSSHFICINWGHGIGSAIIENGEFNRGNSGSSGEFGHITLKKEGPLCECGNRGCLEALASGNAIARDAKAAIAQGGHSKILEIVDYDTRKINAKEVFDAAKLGDELANEIIDQAIEYIGIGLASYINLLDPDLIVLSGGIVNAADIFLDKLKKVSKLHQMKFAGRKVKFRLGGLGEDAAAIGAASIILKDFIEQGGTCEMYREKEESH